MQNIVERYRIGADICPSNMQFKQRSALELAECSLKLADACDVTLTSHKSQHAILLLAARVYLDARLHFQHIVCRFAYSAHGMIPNSASMSQDAARMPRLSRSQVAPYSYQSSEN
jgi:hypothetical protein